MSYNERLTELLSYLGITAGRLPVEGMAPRNVFGLKVWVTPLTPLVNPSRFKRSTHRLLCECPRCGVTLSAGRLHQHANTAACDAALLRATKLAARRSAAGIVA